MFEDNLRVPLEIIAVPTPTSETIPGTTLPYLHDSKDLMVSFQLFALVFDIFLLKLPLPTALFEKFQLTASGKLLQSRSSAYWRCVKE